ncbi:MAG TPA: ChaN family lipoprotein [Longimicrobiales bacterium]
MRNRIRLAPILLPLMAAAACAGRGPSTPAPRGAGVARAPYRLIDMESARPVELPALADRAAAADVIFFGEQHDDAGAHRLEYALLEALAGRRDPVVLSLEMFERDVQPVLDDYLAGRISEEDFLAASRPWPNYATDYRPLVELARARGWPVIAANVPRRYAALVADGGLDTLRSLPPGERDAYIAASIECPRDAYYARFLGAMGAHPGAGAAEARMLRYYQAQCVKDETMAESIVAARAKWPGAPVLHVTGAFHSDYGHGIPARVARRAPGTRMLLVTAIPAARPRDVDLAEQRGRADYIFFTARGEGEGGR